MKWIPLALLGFISIGCAGSTVNKSQMVTLNDRLDRLEKKVESQDSDLEQVRSDLSRIATKTPEPSLSIKEIQTALKKAGFYQGKVDGVAGAKTDRAVKDFQRSKGVKADGKVGHETAKYLQKYLN